MWCYSSIKRRKPFFPPDISNTLAQRCIFKLSIGEWSLT
jgi:hypothetical protein